MKVFVADVREKGYVNATDYHLNIWKYGKNDLKLRGIKI